jgi:hypothetical protein
MEIVRIFYYVHTHKTVRIGRNYWRNYIKSEFLREFQAKIEIPRQSSVGFS